MPTPLEHSGEAALIIGAGPGISASFARLLACAGYQVVLASTRPERNAALAAELGATTVHCDGGNADDVAGALAAADATGKPLGVALYNASDLLRGPIAELDPIATQRAVAVTAFGAFFLAQGAARRMLQRGSGAIFLTGASASIKGYARSAPFAMGKFALRGLAQSLARELTPQNIHVAHFVIDGQVRIPERGLVEKPGNPDSMLDPDAVAENYFSVLRQHRSAWCWEVELRPWTEKF